MSNGTAEIMTPDGDADEERGIQIAELYANLATPEGELRTTDDVVTVPQQREPTHDILDEDEEETPATLEGGKALYGVFHPSIRMAGGLAIEGMRRGRDIVRYRQGIYVGRQAIRVYPGGR